MLIKKGEVVERFIDLVHVSDTSACSLKKEIYSLLSDHSLSPSKIRGQGYDGASNTKGEINSLKTLIMEDSPSAYYIHCFAYQLQLTLVAIAKKHVEVEDFLDHGTNVLNIVGGCFKRRDLLRHHQAEYLKQLLESGEAHTGQGFNQERGLQRPGDTHWGSHFKTLDNFLVIFSTIVHVLGVIEIEGSTSSDRNQAEYLLTKKRLQDARENGWKSLLNDVSSFCDSHDILIPKLDVSYFPEKSKRKCLDVCYSHHLRVEIFFAVIDVQLQELNERFDVVSSDLLLGMGSLNPVNSFSNFDKGRIMTLAKCYPNEFDDGKLRDLSYQLDTFIIHMRGGNFKFSNLQGIRDLAKALVELILILPVATATVERAFSSMKHIKNEVRNSIGDQYLNNCLVCYIERDVFANTEKMNNPIELLGTRLFFTYAKAYESSQGLMRIFSLASPDLSSTGSLDLTVYHSSNMLEVPRTTNLDGIDLLDSFLSHLFRRKYLLKEKCLITGNQVSIEVAAATLIFVTSNSIIAATTSIVAIATSIIATVTSIIIVA
ncbi:uncharacterized protein LOC107858541 [Capsicum annuum]|uniref:uncharacterized protein LOC107858541 n=1 Tax=Capsicum annuum TaxID=4072 RepID=UPI001FB16A64|nr:uncharacterized protein LOC107858541 [Capsicum annuum]